MSSEIAIRVVNVHKHYAIYAKPEDRLKQMILPRIRGAMGLAPSQHFNDFAAVNGVSFEVRRGETVGIVGRNGSGKSTLAHLLLGLYPLASGQICYDGNDLAQMDLSAVRRQLGIVAQQPYLFGNSVRNNIALSDPALPLEDVMAAAQVAQIHDDIMALPLGYETPLLDGGASLSGGQRQRIALARALVHKPAILLLDEATSALDTITERKVQQALAHLRCTRIVIAQRLSTITHADLILVLDNGHLIEQGTHGALLAQAGLYAALVQAQQMAGA